jgi:hypothetical protein
MGRRRDDDDDDDDDFDDRPMRTPKKEGGGGKTVVIVVAIIAFVVVLIVGGCAGLGYWVFYSAKKSVNNTFSQFEASAEADTFLFKLSTDQVQAAYDSAAPSFRSSMSRDALQQLINRNPLLTKHTSRRALTFNSPTGSAPNRKQAISYELSKLWDDPEPWVEPGKPKPTKAAPGPKTITVTVTVAEQPGGFWKVENLTVP